MCGCQTFKRWLKDGSYRDYIIAGAQVFVQDPCRFAFSYECSSCGGPPAACDCWRHQAAWQPLNGRVQALQHVRSLPNTGNTIPNVEATFCRILRVMFGQLRVA